MSWPLLDGPARDHLAGGALVGRRVHVDVATDDASGAVAALLAASGAQVVADPAAELVVRTREVSRGDVVVELPVLDPTADAHATIRAVLRLTNRRLPASRVAVVGFDRSRRELARAVRALGGRVVVVDDDPLHHLAALGDGHDVGAVSAAAIVFTAAGVGAGEVGEPAAGAVVAGPDPAAFGDVVDEPRPGMFRVRRGDRDVYVLDPVAVAGGRAPAAVDLGWAIRLAALAWLAGTELPTGRHTLPVGLQREIAAAALVARVST